MNEIKKTSTFYFWCCLAQSVVIVALAFYMGKEKTEKENLIKEKEMSAFSLLIREKELSNLKAALDTCDGKKE